MLWLGSVLGWYFSFILFSLYHESFKCKFNMLKVLRNTFSTSGLGWPKWRNDHIRNMWLRCCAFWYHRTASYKRFWEKLVLQRCFKEFNKIFIIKRKFSPPNVMKICRLKIFDFSNSYAGNHTPGSPSLSARLCTGNGELAKYSDEVPSEEICLRIQESY